MISRKTNADAASGQAADSGPCASCGARNSHAAKRCHGCSALLPWASEPAPKIKAAPVKAAPAKTTKAAWDKPQARIDWGYWGVAAFSFLIPVIGFVLYRSYSESGSEKASAAGVGAVLGILFHLVRFFFRVQPTPF